MTAAPLTLADGRVVQVDPVDVLTGDDHVKTFVEWQARWKATARDSQIPEFTNWSECGFLAGRGFGKTRVGAEWLTRSVFLDPSGFDSCVIAPTYQDIQITCMEGESGLLSVLPPELLVCLLYTSDAADDIL
jgi:phage terminase large subunit-like protein